MIDGMAADLVAIRGQRGDLRPCHELALTHVPADDEERGMHPVRGEHRARRVLRGVPVVEAERDDRRRGRLGTRAARQREHEREQLTAILGLDINARQFPHPAASCTRPTSVLGDSPKVKIRARAPVPRFLDSSHERA